MQVNTMQELKAAAKRREPEIVVTDSALASRVIVLDKIRLVANILVFVILGLALFAWADPLRWDFLRTDGARLGRQIMLGFGLALLFVEYVLPVVRVYKIAGVEQFGLKLVPRRAK